MRWLSRRLARTELPTEQVVVLGPYDQLILQIDRRIPKDVMLRLRAQLNEQADERVIILESGLKLVGVRQRPAVPTPDIGELSVDELLALRKANL